MEQSVLIAIKSGLSIIETCLRDILRQTKADSNSGNSLFKVRTSDLNDNAASDLVGNAQKMLTEIQELQRKFEIETATESARWRVVNDLNQIWSTLSELSEDKLGGYGQMQPEESRLLASHVERMEAVRKDMERIVSG
ncbi:MAG: hypothetical protein ACLP5V_12240 [Candidatus Bathyarchaeia archaeon]